MNIRVTEDAADDLEHIKARIARDNRSAATRIVGRIRTVIRMLSEQPYLGHNGLVEGTYEKTVPRTPYVIVYRIDLEPRNELVILRAPHTSQERSHYEY